MRGQAVLAILSLLTVALAGCSGAEPALDDLEGEPQDTHDEAGGNQTAEATNETAPNRAPTANVTASATNGTAPLNVTFTLDGSDADGDDLTWTFTVGNVTENGTALPATVDVTLEAGNWTATLTVSDGRNETVATSDVAVAAAAGPACTTQEPVVRSGNANGGAAHTGFFSTVTFDLEPCQTRMSIMHTYDITGGDRDMQVYDPDDNLVAESDDDSLGSDGPIVIDDPALLSKTGTWTVRIYVQAGGPAAYEVEVTFGDDA